VLADILTPFSRIHGFGPRQPFTDLPVFRCRVERVYPHDPGAFTQGLQYADGLLYESTGRNGRSSIRKVQLETGEVVQQRSLAAEHFGEGITLWQSSLIQLTWRSGVAFVYDKVTFEVDAQFTYPGEGWGLANDTTNLIMSDGSSHLRVLDPATFAECRRISVTASGEPLPGLNELALVKGEIFANLFGTDYIACIAPDGRLTGWLDLRGLLSSAERRNADVLNGIAYDAKGDRLFVTGKLWPKLFEIAILAR
jgi:glutamine cyclotransferase